MATKAISKRRHKREFELKCMYICMCMRVRQNNGKNDSVK